MAVLTNLLEKLADLFRQKEQENKMPEVDMKPFSPASLIAKAVEAVAPDLKPLNQQEASGYAKAVEQWKLDRDRGFPRPVPDPPLAYVLKVDAPGGTVAVIRGTEPVCPKFIDPGTPEVPLIVAIGAAIPGMPGCFARGYNAAMVPDNAPNGYRYQPFGPGGPVFQKVIVPGFFAGMFTAYYQLVQ